MDNAQKAIMIGVGLFITIIVIGAVMAITGVGTNLLSQGQAKLGDLSGNLQATITQQYDNKQWSGSQIKAEITKLYSDNTMAVMMCETAAATAFTSINGLTATIPAATTLAHAGYASPTVATTAVTTGARDASTWSTQILNGDRYRSVTITFAGSVVGVAFLEL